MSFQKLGMELLLIKLKMGGNKINNQNLNNNTDEEMVLNIGPQHPSTHGVLRLKTITDGEIIKKITPYIGYLHLSLIHI